MIDAHWSLNKRQWLGREQLPSEAFTNHGSWPEIVGVWSTLTDNGLLEGKNDGSNHGFIPKYGGFLQMFCSNSGKDESWSGCPFLLILNTSLEPWFSIGSVHVAAHMVVFYIRGDKELLQTLAEKDRVIVLVIVATIITGNQTWLVSKGRGWDHLKKLFEFLGLNLIPECHP